MRVYLFTGWPGNERLRMWGWVLFVGLGVLPTLLGPSHTDESWPLYLAHRVLDGQRHGIDFFEINPPLYIWLCIPAALVRRLAGIPEWQTWIVMVAAAALACLGLTCRLLARFGESEAHRGGFLLVAGFVLLVLPRGWFSEREHLALILTLPFLVLTAHRAQQLTVRRSDAIAVGVMGAVGFSIKPHFLIAWLLLELWLAVRIRRTTLRRDELWALVGFGATYLLAVVIFAPDYFAMVRRLAPLYHAYLNNGLAGTLVLAGPALLFLTAIAAALRAALKPDDRLLDVLTMAFLGLFVAALVQQKGLQYHFLAVWGFGLLMLARAWQLRPATLSWYPSGILVRIGAIMVAALMVTRTASAARELVQPGHPRYLVSPEYPELVRLTRERAGGEPIIVLSTNPVGGWPLTLDAGARWSSRYMHFWPMVAIHDRQLWSLPPRIVDAGPLDHRSETERRFMDEIIEDLTRHRPRLVLVLSTDIAQWGKGGSQRFDYLEYFGADPRFREFISGYRFLKQVGDYQVWVPARHE